MNKAIKEQVRDFVLETFRHFDNLDDIKIFLPRIYPKIRFVTSDGTYDGHAGFRRWYHD